MTSPTGLLCALVLALALLACGGAPPPPARGVLEEDVGAWQFRRYQQAVDVEVWVPDNEAVAHTASYASKAGLERGRLDDRDIVNAFVTRYERDAGIPRALVTFARRLAQESGYVVEERTVSGVRVIQVAGHGETWVLWPAPAHIVKIGGRAIDAVPAALIDAYGDRYPSRLQPGALEGPLPPADEPEPDGDEDDSYDSGDPRPDWERYDPDKVDTPGSR